MIFRWKKADIRTTVQDYPLLGFVVTRNMGPFAFTIIVMKFKPYAHEMKLGM